jgi:hypothetical protein
MVNQIRVKGGVLLGALVSGALAAGTLTGAPTANATCASFFGINSGGDCTSNLTSIAIGIGNNAQAHADGFFGSAFSIGTKAFAGTGDAFTFATAVGDNAQARALGLFGIAAQLGPNGGTATQGSGSLGNIGANIAISVAPASPDSTVTSAAGFGNIAVNLLGNASGFGTHRVYAIGIVNIATNLLGTDNGVYAGSPGTPGTGTFSFNAFGSGNKVLAGPGPLAVAGSILQTGQTITKAGPGFNINGVIIVGGAAAVRNAKTSAPTAAAVHTGKGTASAASALGGTKKTAAPSASRAGKK